MINKYKDIKKIMRNPLLVKKLFLANGYLEVNELDDTGDNNFVVETDDSHSEVKYNTNIDILVILSILFPKFSNSEVKALKSMLKFHNDLFCEKNEKNGVNSLYVSMECIEFTSDLVTIEINESFMNGYKTSYEIIQYNDFFNTQSYSGVPKFKDIQQEMIKQYKKSISVYCNKDIKIINSRLINKIVNETFDSCNYRINSKGLYNINYFKKIFENISEKNIKYKFLEDDGSYSGNKSIDKESFLDNDIFMVKKQDKDNPVNVDTPLNSLNNGVAIILQITNLNVLSKILENIFVEKDISYILSIISLLHFINKINDYGSDNFIVNIWIDSTIHKTKESVFESEHMAQITIDNFRFDIGRNIDIYYSNLDDYSEDVSSIIEIDEHMKQENLAIAYDNLLENLKKNILNSLEINELDLGWQHIMLLQMLKI